MGRMRKGIKYVATNYQLYILMAWVMAWHIIFRYFPIYGLQMAFMEYNPIKGFSGSPWVGLDQFVKLFKGLFFIPALRNTVVLSFYSLIVGFPFPIILALSLNTLKDSFFKKSVQTVSYAPHFISTVVIVGMLKLFLSPSTGFINHLIEFLGGTRTNFFGDTSWFSHLYVWSGVWQSTGWSAVIYFAALAGINPELHEAATVDGASRVRRIWHIDLPGILPTTIILLIMSSANIVNVGFEKAFLMQTPLNLSTSEIISTYAYKVGMLQSLYSFSAAVGFFNSFVTFVLLMIINAISRRLSETSLW